MSARVSRAVAEPPAITWAPLPLVGVNCLLWAMTTFFGLVFYNLSPLIPLSCLVACHAVLAGWGAREPHLASILTAAAAHLQPTRSPVQRKGRHYAA